MDLKNFKTTGEKIIYIREQRFERYGYAVDHPVFHFGGKWLAALGFRRGRRARIQFTPGRIVITPVDPVSVLDDEQAEADERTPEPVLTHCEDVAIAAEPGVPYTHPAAVAGPSQKPAHKLH